MVNKILTPIQPVDCFDSNHLEIIDNEIKHKLTLDQADEYLEIVDGKVIRKRLPKHKDEQISKIVGYITIVSQGETFSVCAAETLPDLMNQVRKITCHRSYIKISFDVVTGHININQGKQANTCDDDAITLSGEVKTERIYPITDNFCLRLDEKHQSALYGLMAFCRKYAPTPENCDVLDIDNINEITLDIVEEELNKIAQLNYSTRTQQHEHPFEKLLKYIPKNTLDYIFNENLETQFLRARKPHNIVITQKPITCEK